MAHIVPTPNPIAQMSETQKKHNRLYMALNKVSESKFSVESCDIYLALPYIDEMPNMKKTVENLKAFHLEKMKSYDKDFKEFVDFDLNDKTAKDTNTPYT